MKYKEANLILSKLFNVPGKGAAAFRGRINHLRRLGVPSGVHTGKGTPAVYGLRQLHELAFCLELAQFGIDPTEIATLVRAHADIADRIGTERAAPSPADLFLVANPAFMSGNWKKPRRPLTWRWVLGTAGILSSEAGRFHIMNISALARELNVAQIAAGIAG